MKSSLPRGVEGGVRTGVWGFGDWFCSFEEQGFWTFGAFGLWLWLWLWPLAFGLLAFGLGLGLWSRIAQALGRHMFVPKPLQGKALQKLQGARRQALAGLAGQAMKQKTKTLERQLSALLSQFQWELQTFGYIPVALRNGELVVVEAGSNDAVFVRRLRDVEKFYENKNGQSDLL